MQRNDITYTHVVDVLWGFSTMLRFREWRFTVCSHIPRAHGYWLQCNNIRFYKFVSQGVVYMAGIPTNDVVNLEIDCSEVVGVLYFDKQDGNCKTIFAGVFQSNCEQFPERKTKCRYLVFNGWRRTIKRATGLSTFHVGSRKTWKTTRSIKMCFSAFDELWWSFIVFHNFLIAVHGFYRFVTDLWQMFMDFNRFV